MLCLQGRVRTKTVKKSARLVVERFYQKLSQNDFDTNKRVSFAAGSVAV
jgi:ribosomal protein S17E